MLKEKAKSLKKALSEKKDPLPEMALRMVETGLNILYPWILLRLDFNALLKVKWMRQLLIQLRDYNKTGKLPSRWGE